MANTIKLKNSGTSSNTPSSLEYGEIAINYADGKLFYKDGGGSISEFANARASVSDTAPSSPSEGDIWFESDTGDVFVYYDSVWVDVGGTSVANIAMSDTAPSSPVNGDFWFETDTGKTFVYYDDGTSQQWIEVGAASAAADGSDGAVQFASGGALYSDASNLYWDDTNNRLGIGTNSPSQELDVNGDIVVPVGNGIMFDRSGTDLHILYKETPTSTTYGAGDDVILRNPNGADILFQTNGSNTRLTIDSSGNVGIGTTSPASPLEIADGSAGQIRFEPTPIAIGSNGDGYELNLVGGTPDSYTNAGGRIRLGGGTRGDGDVSNIIFMRDTTESMRIDSSGNVGIGTTSPSQSLDVNGNAHFTSQVLIDDDGSVRIGSTNDTGGRLRMHHSTNGNAYLDYYDSLYFRSGSTSSAIKMTFTSGGNVGIGTTGPQVPLHIYKADVSFTPNTDYDMLILENGTSGRGPVLQLVGPTNGLAEIAFSDTSRNHAQINYNFSTNEMNFKVNNATRLWINGSGIVHPEGNGTQSLGASTRRWADVWAVDTSINSSDQRDKSNILDIDYGLEFINSLRPVTYTWNDRSGFVGVRKHMGFIAQEVAESMGEEAANRGLWVSAPAVDRFDPETESTVTDPDVQALRYGELMAPMVKAIQELTARIEALEAN